MPSSGEKERILVVDDSAATLEVLERNLRGQGYRVMTAASVADALGILDATPADLVITDFKMPRTSGIELVRHVRENLPDTEVMMITGYASVQGAVDAVKSGAEEYLAKPFTDDELADAVRRVLGKLAMRRAAGARGPATPRAPIGLLGESGAMQPVFVAIAKAALTPATVLISGESGTGKESVARAIHYGSARASAPFVPVNCGAIPEALAGERAVRARQGCLHRRARLARRLLPDGRRGHDPPRRDRRNLFGVAGQAPAGPPG